MAAVMASDSQILALSRCHRGCFAFYGHKDDSEKPCRCTPVDCSCGLTIFAYAVGVEAPQRYSISREDAFSGYAALSRCLWQRCSGAAVNQVGALGRTLFTGAAVTR